jgi:hypothetical protein
MTSCGSEFGYNDFSGDSLIMLKGCRNFNITSYSSANDFDGGESLVFVGDGATYNADSITISGLSIKTLNGGSKAYNINTSLGATTTLQNSDFLDSFVNMVGVTYAKTGQFKIHNLARAQVLEIDSTDRLLYGKTVSLDANQNKEGCEMQTSGTMAASRASGQSLYLNRMTTDGSLAGFYRQSVGVGSITVTGTATAYNTSSDYRLKENVLPMTGSIDRLKALKPSKFNFITEPLKVVDGFLAHEAGEVVPECATGIKDAVNEDGTPDYQGIDQSKLVPLLVSALQEAISRIETLENA